MKNCYINGIGSVTIQAIDFDLFQSEIQPIQILNKAQQPSYKDLIAPAMSRRMAKGVKMSIYAANEAMHEAKMVDPHAIIIGTGLGCIEDSEKFLDAIVVNDEQFLTPTAFIQSTHNTVAAQIALNLQCKAYNFTYVNGGNSFENALFDAFMQLKHFNKENILVGGVDEIASYTFSMYELSGKVKREGDAIDFMQPTTTGVAFAEGAQFFAISSKKTNNSYAEIKDMMLFNAFNKSEEATIIDFLAKNNTSIADIDVVVLGVNADVNQQRFYDKISALFANNAQAYYQHISGTYDTASAFALHLGSKIIQKGTYPKNIQYNQVKPEKITQVLIINQDQLTDYSFVLLQKC